MADSSKESQEKQKSGESKTEPAPSNLDWKKIRLAGAWFVFIESASLVLWQEAEDFSGSAANCIHFISKCGVLLGGTVALHKVAKSKKMVWISFVLLCVSMAIITISKNSAKSNARLELTLTTSTFPKSILELTNSFLISSNYGVPLGDDGGYLCVPVHASDANVFIKFFVFNASSDLNSSGIEVSIILPNAANVLHSPEWQTSIVNPISTTKQQMDMLSWRTHDTLLPFSWLDIPALCFNAKMPDYQEWGGKRFPMMIRIRSQDTPQFIVSFWVAFPDLAASQTNYPPAILSRNKNDLRFDGTKYHWTVGLPQK